MGERLSVGSHRAVPVGCAVAFLAFAAGFASLPARAATPQIIAALGDSFTAEIDASVPCQYAALTPAYACPDGTGFLPVVARALDREAPTAFQNLALSASHTVTIPLFEVPKLSPAATAVVLFIGIADLPPIADKDNYTLEQWREDYEWAVSSIHARAPKARVILATLPNPAYIPFFIRGAAHVRLTPERRTVWWRTGEAMNAVITSLGEDILDLHCMRSMYEEPTLATDIIHPNDEGYAIIAARILDILRSPTRVTANAVCPPYTDPV